MNLVVEERCREACGVSEQAGLAVFEVVTVGKSTHSCTHRLGVSTVGVEQRHSWECSKLDEAVNNPSAADNGRHVALIGGVFHVVAHLQPVSEFERALCTEVCRTISVGVEVVETIIFVVTARDVEISLFVTARDSNVVVLSESAVLVEFIVPVGVTVVNVLSLLVDFHWVVVTGSTASLEFLEPRVGVALETVESSRHRTVVVIPSAAEVFGKLDTVGYVVRSLGRALETEVTCIVNRSAFFLCVFGGYEHNSESTAGTVDSA